MEFAQEARVPNRLLMRNETAKRRQMRLVERVATEKSERWSACIIGGTCLARKSYAERGEGRGAKSHFLMRNGQTPTRLASATAEA